MTDAGPASAFVCRQCGDCCRGQGGIVVTGTDIDRLCAYLKIPRETFAHRYLEQVDGKTRVRTVNDWCVFFNTGCSVHPAKPTVCRAWPFFRGNMLDELSWQMAQDACPGINPKAGHAAFVRQGLLHLRDLDLDGMSENGPNALNLDRLSTVFQS
ncbi:MAG TPA: YkgJ family cysteine cluster protein [Desulfonatronum sp.]|nr:YkgJ family cysteine cluster protein [Desulfonatronum sp.]